MHFFRRDQRKALVQIETHLVAKHAFGAGAGAIGLGYACRVDVAHEVFVLAAHGVLAGGGRHGREVWAAVDASILEASQCHFRATSNNRWPYNTKLCKTCRVNASAGKKVSIASSCKVTSTGVPKTVVVLIKLSTPVGV